MNTLFRTCLFLSLLLLVACTGGAPGSEAVTAAPETGLTRSTATPLPAPTEATPEVTPPTSVPTPTNDPTPTSVPTPMPAPAPTATPPAARSDAEGFIAALQTALAGQMLDTLPRLMTDPIGSGPWRSEWTRYTPDELVAAFQNGSVPAPAAVQFSDLDEAAIGELLGQPPETLLGPDSGFVTAIHSTGWGYALSDEAILFISEQDGVYRWSGLVYTPGRFTDAQLPVVPPPPGLRYLHPATGAFELLPDGTTGQILDAETAATPNLTLAPDGRHAAYLTGERQLWLIDTATGKRRQLAAGLTLSNFLMWADADTLFTGVWLTPEEGEGPNAGHLTTVELDGTTQLVDPDALTGNLPALAPDGLTIAYDAIPRSATDPGGAWLYAPDSGVTPFEKAEFAPAGDLIDGALFNPTWSPDGRQMTWLVSTGERNGLQLFDLEQQTVTQLYNWEPARFGGPVPAPVWSQDGQWLALTVLAHGPTGSGLHLIAVDGSEVRLVDAQGFNPVWAGDTGLVFDALGLARIYDLTTGAQSLLDLPEGSRPHSYADQTR